MEIKELEKVNTGVFVRCCQQSIQGGSKRLYAYGQKYC